MAEEQQGLRLRPLALPGALLSGHATRRHPHVVQHVRHHARFSAGPAIAARRSCEKSTDAIPGHVPLRFPPVGNPWMAEADLDDRLAGSEGDVRPAAWT